MSTRSGWIRGRGCSTSDAVPAATRSHSRGAELTWLASIFRRTSSRWPETRPRRTGCRRASWSATSASLAYDGEFDAVVCLCQGGFGLLGGRDEPWAFERIAAALRPGGRLALTAFSAAFAARFLEAGESFDPATGVLHERSVVPNEDGEEEVFDLWTTCFTARELELLARRAGLDAVGVHGVAPGRYGTAPPTLDDPELLLLARRHT